MAAHDGLRRTCAGRMYQVKVGEPNLPRDSRAFAFHLPGANWPFYWFWTPIRIEGRIFVGSSVMVFLVPPAFD